MNKSFGSEGRRTEPLSLDGNRSRGFVLWLEPYEQWKERESIANRTLPHDTNG